jgi:hypothetical protein
VKRLALLVAIALALSLAAGGCPRPSKAVKEGEVTNEDTTSPTRGQDQTESEDSAQPRQPVPGVGG